MTEFELLFDQEHAFFLVTAEAINQFAGNEFEHQVMSPLRTTTMETQYDQPQEWKTEG